MKNKNSKDTKFEYEVAISFAGENRDIANQIARALRKKGISVFYDEFYKTDLWGKILSNWFKKTYGKSSRFILVLVSQKYPIKDWTNFEFSIAREEEKKRKEEFILPVRLDDTKIHGLSSDKAYLDFKKEGINGVVDCLFQKVKSAASEKLPEQIFREAYEEWKIDGFLPGNDKANYFFENLSEIKLDSDSCEFLLRSSDDYYLVPNEKIKLIDRKTLFNAALRLLKKGNDEYTRLKAIWLIASVSPDEAEPYLWDLYKDVNENLGLRAEAFERLWKSKRGIDESYSIALKNREWKLRRAAIKNIRKNKARKNTLKVLAGALKDGRWQVRIQAAYTISKLKLEDLVPDLITAMENERSKKGVNAILYSISNFKHHKNVKEFMKKHDIPKWFYITSDDHTIYEDQMDDTL